MLTKFILWKTKSIKFFSWNDWAVKIKKKTISKIVWPHCALFSISRVMILHFFFVMTGAYYYWSFTCCRISIFLSLFAHTMGKNNFWRAFFFLCDIVFTRYFLYLYNNVRSMWCKGGLISNSFSSWLKSPIRCVESLSYASSLYVNSTVLKDIDLAHFWRDLSQS